MKTAAPTVMGKRYADLRRLYSKATIVGECVVADRLFWNGAQFVNAPRFAYEAIEGPLKKEQALRHTCGRGDCVNPYHMRVKGAA